MDIKAIVLDLDGTLLNGDKRISMRTKDKLIGAQKQGIKVVLASGRPMRSMLAYAKELEMEKFEGLLVSNNGACVYDLKAQEILFDQAISFEMKNKIIHHLNQFEVAFQVQSDYRTHLKSIHDLYL